MSKQRINPCEIGSCGKLTSNIYNINMKKVAICESCAVSITLQQVSWWATDTNDLQAGIRTLNEWLGE